MHKNKSNKRLDIPDSLQIEAYQHMTKELRKLLRSYSKNYVTAKVLDESIKHHYARMEQKLVETKTEALKWFIKISVAQTLVIIALVFALLYFVSKK